MPQPNPAPGLRRDTRVFLSAVTRELGSIRKLAKKALEDNDYHAVEQDNFPPDYRDLVAKLRARIASCDAVIHVAGLCFGAEPPNRPADAPRRSYTQLEYEIARELGKPIYVFVTGEGFPADPHEPEPAELRDLQEAHRRRLMSTGQDYNPTSSAEELDRKLRSLQLKVERMGEELRAVDDEVRATDARLRRRLLAIGGLAALALVAIGAVLWWQRAEREAQARERSEAKAARRDVAANLTGVGRDLEDLRKQFADPDVLTGKLKSQIRKKADEELAAARANDPDDWETLGAIETRRDQALERVEDLVDTIREGLSGAPDPIFVEAADILNRRGLDEAIRYLEAKQPAVEKQIGKARSLRDQAEEKLREACRPIGLQADLYDANLEWEKSLVLRREIAGQCPLWFDAQSALGDLLRRLGRLDEAEAPLRQALALAKAPEDREMALTNLAVFLIDAGRAPEAEPPARQALELAGTIYEPDHPILAVRLDNLAQVLKQTGGEEEAESLMRLALKIEEATLGPEAGDVGITLGNLGSLLYARGENEEAEALLRRALRITEGARGRNHPDVAIRLNALAAVLNDTGRSGEAEGLYRRALAIAEDTLGTTHPTTAGILSNLAALLVETDRPVAAEPLYRRALAIEDEAAGRIHPALAQSLNLLGKWLLETSRPEQAEPLFRRALEITEAGLRPAHPDASMSLNNLGSLLLQSDRTIEAEPFLRRALEIEERAYGPDDARIVADLNNLAQLLQQTGREPGAEPLMRRVLEIEERAEPRDPNGLASAYNNLGRLLQDTGRKAEAEPLIRRALEIGESANGPDDPGVANHLNNLGGLLIETDREADAEPMMARAVRILAGFGRSTGHPHPKLEGVAENYRALLGDLGHAEDEVESRLRAALEDDGPLAPMVPEVERILGAARPVADVLAELDRAAERADGHAAALRLGPGEPLAPHLDAILGADDATWLILLGANAYRRGHPDDAVAIDDMALDRLKDGPEHHAQRLTLRANRAAAWRDLGLVERARDELESLVPELERSPTPDPVGKGRACYHLAVCQWFLGDRDAARRSAEASRADYAAAPEDDPAPDSFVGQTERLLAALQEGEDPPILDEEGGQAAIEAARERLRAREAMARLPLDQPAGPLLDAILGPARPVAEVLEELDREYRDAERPEVWTLPLSEPIAPHLDELLGPEER